MRPRTIAACLAALGALLAPAGMAAAALVGVYRNGMGSQAQREQILKLAGDRCARSAAGTSIRVFVGKRTSECAYRTPVIGRDLEIAATERLLSGTPKKLQHRAYLGLNLRAGGGGAHYQLAVYPFQRKVQLRKARADGKLKYLEIAKDVGAVQGVGRANQLRLRAFNVTSGPDKGSCRLIAWVGGRQVANVLDGHAGELQGRTSGFGVGASGNAKGTVATVDDVVIRVPNPF
jgi:hypothetical protein